MNGSLEPIKFTDNDFELVVKMGKENDTVWLTQEQIAKLFGKARSTIAEHINNIFSDEELDKKLLSVFPTKASITDHPFVDGRKRIAATLFLEFLNRNNALVKEGKLILSNDALVAITVLTAESKPEEMDIVIKLMMNFLTKEKEDE